MWQERQAELLKDEIEAVLASLSSVASLYSLAKEPLTKARRGLSIESGSNRPWSLLPLIVSEAISGHYEQTLSAAAALQFLMAAGDVFDDIEDADSSESLLARYGPAMATNAATTLLILAEKSIARLKEKGVEDGIIVQVMDVISSHYTTACAGQHLDLSLNREEFPSEEVYLEIAGMKSASQIECACQVGAILAGAKLELVELFSRFGYNLGMASQITNDIQGVKYGGDVVKRKITLPIIYALNQVESSAHGQLWLAFGKQSESVLDTTQIRDLLFQTGAVYYATVKMEYYKFQALENLAKAEMTGARTDSLKLFFN